MSDYLEKQRALENRTVLFSVDIIKVCGHYAQDPSLRPLINQVIRSSSSIGANYAEANNASSKADFRNKIFISKKEAAETVYWLRVLYELTNDDKLLVFQKVVSTMKSDVQNGK